MLIILEILNHINNLYLLLNHKLDYGNFEKVYQFINSISNTRSVISNLNTIGKTTDSLKAAKNNLVLYLQMIHSLKSKFNFGSEDFSIRIEFSWKDSLLGDFSYSNNINLDYYSTLYNLGVVYGLLGQSANIRDPDLNETSLKEAIKHFQYAGWLFDKIRNEVLSSLSSKEITPDLAKDNLTFVS